MRQFLFKLVFVILLMLLNACSSVKLVSKINDPISVDIGDDGSFNIITYNVQDLFGKGTKKLDALTRYFNREDYDFVLLQELFNEGTREYILSSLDTNKYKSIISRIDYSTFPEYLFNDAGLFFMSKYPFVDLSSIQFSNGVENTGKVIHKLLNKDISLSMDFLANKSIAASVFQVNDSTQLLLASTHVQALGSKRQKLGQLRQIRQFIEQAVYRLLESKVVKDPRNLVVMLAGDFNSDAYNELRNRQLITNLGNPRDLHFEFKPAEKEYTFQLRMFDRKLRFDYIFAYDKIADFQLRKVIIKSINATDLTEQTQGSISDHFALKATVGFGR